MEALLIFLGLAIATFICGYLPSFIKASPRIMSHIALFGGGTIVGAALIVVLPEACGILINSQHKLDELDDSEAMHSEEDAHQVALHISTGPQIVAHKTSNTIGIAIAIGFSSMFLIDQIFKLIDEHRIEKQLMQYGMD